MNIGAGTQTRVSPIGTLKWRRILKRGRSTPRKLG